MTVVAVTMVKDEADVIGPVVGHLFAEGVDRVIVADNLSTDATPGILASLAERHPLTVLADTEFAYDQSKKMTGLAVAAHEVGATWVLPFDADEVWSGVGGTIADTLDALPEDVDVVLAAGFDHIVRQPADGPFSPWRRPHPQPLCKVAFRARPDIEVAMGNHDVRPAHLNRVQGPLTYRHFQYRSLEQMTAKLRNGRAVYEASDIHPMHGTHWREGGLLSDGELYAKWAALCSESGLVFDPAPFSAKAAA